MALKVSRVILNFLIFDGEKSEKRFPVQKSIFIVERSKTKSIIYRLKYIKLPPCVRVLICR